MLPPEQVELIRQHSNEIAKILYADTDPATLDSLEAIETTVRQKMLEHVSPEVGIFLSKQTLVQQQEKSAL
jgi:hypothetical protein